MAIGWDTAQERLLSCIEYDTNGGCWLFAKSLGHSGYGQFYPVRGQPWAAHRVSWFIHNGPIPEGLSVLHRCDVRPCFRPDHLFLGTQRDNVHDCMRKGRHSKPPLVIGENNWRNKLREAEVIEIRRLWATGDFTQQALGDIFGVGQSAVSVIVRRKLWKNI